MILSDLLDHLATELAGPGIPPARADARDLIAAVLDQPKFWPSAHPSLELDAATTRAIREAAARLGRGMPFQYAVGKASFRHLTLCVDPNVLIPRAETELIVDIVLALTRGEGEVADVGTGCGAIALALAAEGRFRRVIATEVSPAALAVARRNLGALREERRAVVDFREGSLLAPLHGERLSAVVANPPYISPAEAGDLPSSVRDWEPPLALFSAEDGMAAIRAFVRDAPAVLEPGGALVLEVDARRAGLARDAATGVGRWRDVEIRRDLTGRERFLVARRKES
ncbi:MAG TPA: peptide chain release factor N(5)-glutamine methyltransferase [Gemmatimonadaceae bacterium]|nr:peptide chain release factor N(5)-glutamine methyltransferase [Gemmatimonadaceae bacterium]